MRRTQQSLAIAVVVLCLGLGTLIQAEAHEGATRSDGLGDVHFSVSCTDAAQAQFHRAMALYHSFDWPRGKAAFDEVTSVDPRCGMAYWGLAMVAADNPFGWPISLKLKEGAEAIQKAQDIGATTPRERGYIAALAVLYKDHATVPHRQCALELKPDLARAYMYRGVLFTQMGDLASARADYEQLLQLAPELAARLERIIAGADERDEYDGLVGAYE